MGRRQFRAVEVARSDEHAFRLVYSDTFVPSHDARTIVEAARLLADEPGIPVQFIGDGPDEPAAIALAREYAPSNVCFLD